MSTSQAIDFLNFPRNECLRSADNAEKDQNDNMKTPVQV